MRQREINPVLAASQALIWRWSSGKSGTAPRESPSGNQDIEKCPMSCHAPSSAINGAARAWAVDYSHGYSWIVLLVKLMSRSARLAPLSATTPVGWPPSPVAQIRLSWTW